MTHDTIVASQCPSCHHPLPDRYCSNCGEKKMNHHDLSLKHQAEELLEGFTHLDNKLFRTVKLLVARPGVLSCNYSRGLRVPYMKPFPLFIVCNLLFFLLQGKGNVFALGLYTYAKMDPYRWFGTTSVVNKTLAGGISMDALNLVFNAQVVTQSKALIFLFVPVLTLASALLFAHQRRLMAEHLIFATHFFSFVILYYLFADFLINKPYSWLSRQPYNETFDLVTSLLGLVIIMGYYARAARRFYRVTKKYAAISGLVIGVVYFFSMYGYRMLLFFKIIAGITV